jgi:hypothetical protein
VPALDQPVDLLGNPLAVKGPRIPNAVEGDRREAEALAQLQTEYPEAEIYPERAIRGPDQQELIDPQSGEGRRFDFVVVQDGEIQDIVEVTSPEEDKTIQLAKTERILAQADGEAYIRVPGTDRLIRIPQSFEGERVLRLP